MNCTKFCTSSTNSSAPSSNLVQGQPQRLLQVTSKGLHQSLHQLFCTAPIFQHHIISRLLDHCCTKTSTLDCDNSSLQMSLHDTARDHCSNCSNTFTQGFMHHTAPSILHHTSSSILHQCSCTKTSTLHRDFSTAPWLLHHNFTNVLTASKVQQ